MNSQRKKSETKHRSSEITKKKKQIKRQSGQSRTERNQSERSRTLKQQRFSAENAEKVPRERVNIEEIRLIVEPVCESEGMELVHVEFQREPQGRVMRLYIDKPDGITLDDCVCISRQVSDLLDVSFPFPELEYSLEISSPGPNRPLGKESDFERFKGNVARIRTSEPVDGQKNFYGLLQGFSQGMVTIMVSGKAVTIPFQQITKARLVNYTPHSSEGDIP
jgi:ribosome maturation factor RimP